MTRPVWLLDFDGVINIIGWGGTAVRRAWGDTRSSDALGYKLTVSDRLTREIKHLHESGLVEVRWLTTWEDYANEHLIKELDWPELAVAGRSAESIMIERRFTGDVGWWKLEFAQEIYNSGARVIWTDDDITSSSDARSWLKTCDPERMNWTCPHSGLMPDDFAMIKRVIKRWNDQPAT